MTVQELIDELNKYPTDMEVYIEIPRPRKCYQPQYELSVIRTLHANWDKHQWVVALVRGKQNH